MKCPECGEGQVSPLARFGRRWRYRTIPDLPIPANLEIPTCSSCDADYIDLETAKRLDRALAPAYEEAMRRKATQSLDILAERGIRQRNIEPLLGLSNGYLSKIRGGKETSPPLVSILMLLASDPQLIERLKKLWEVSPAAREEDGVSDWSWEEQPSQPVTAQWYVAPPSDSDDVMVEESFTLPMPRLRVAS